MLLAVLVGAGFGIASAVIAANKGRHPLAWFALGFFLPLVGLIAAIAVAPIYATAGEALRIQRDGDRGRHRLLGD